MHVFGLRRIRRQLHAELIGKGDAAVRFVIGKISDDIADAAHVDDPLISVACGELIDVGALGIDRHIPRKLPARQVRGRIKTELPAADEDAPHPVLHFKHLRVAEGDAVVDIRSVDDTLMLDKGHAAVEAVRHPLVLVGAAVHRVVDDNVLRAVIVIGRVFDLTEQPAHVLPVDDRRAGPHVIPVRRQEGEGKVFPRHEVLGTGVPPIHIPPQFLERLMLIIQMIIFAVEHQPVRVVVPAAERRIVILVPVQLCIAREIARPEIHFVERGGRVKDVRSQRAARISDGAFVVQNDVLQRDRLVIFKAQDVIHIALHGGRISARDGDFQVKFALCGDPALHAVKFRLADLIVDIAVLIADIIIGIQLRRRKRPVRTLDKVHELCAVRLAVHVQHERAFVRDAERDARRLPLGKADARRVDVRIFRGIALPDLADRVALRTHFKGRLRAGICRAYGKQDCTGSTQRGKQR